jgi:pilus assembly protein CpaB
MALALVFGGSVAAGVKLLIKHNSGGAGPETVSVVVAAGNISRGTTVSADLLKTRDMPKDSVPEGVVTKVEDAIDRMAYSPLVKDEIILDGKLTPRGSGRGMAALIPAGMRAFTIQTPSVAAGVAGFVLPGDKVDVLLTVASQYPNDPTGGGTTTTLLQNVEILAVDQRVDAPADNKVDPKELRSVTVLVTPDQANKLDLGQNKGTLHLSLRNPEDNQPAKTKPTTLADLRFHQEMPWDEKAKGLLQAVGKAFAGSKLKNGVKDPEPPMARIRTLRGTQEGVILFQPLTGASQGQ